MHPVLLVWRGGRIHAYPALMYVGLVLGILAAWALAPGAGLDPFRVWLSLLLLTPPAIFGSRLLFVATHWARYRHDVRAIWRRSAGGGAMYGGLPLSLAVSVPLLWVLELPFGAFWDVATFTLLIGMVFVRIGCLMNGCCSGLPTTGWLGMYLPGADRVWRRRVPTQVLEGALGLAVLAAAFAVRHALMGHGLLFLGVCGAYAAGRAGLEATREHVQRVGGVSLNRAISGALIAASLLGLAWLRP